MTDYRCVNGHDKCGEMYAGPECPYCERTDDTSAALERLKDIAIRGPRADTIILDNHARAILAHIADLEARAKEAEAEVRDMRQAGSAVSACGETTPLDLREWRPFELSQAIQRIGLRAEAAEAREAELRSALEKIADEQKVYRGHGDYTIEPAYSAEEAQGMARQALAAAPAAPEKPSGGSGWLPANPPIEWIEAMARAGYAVVSTDPWDAEGLAKEFTRDLFREEAAAAYAALARKMEGRDAE